VAATTAEATTATTATAAAATTTTTTKTKVENLASADSHQGMVDLVVNYALNKYSNMDKVQKFIDKLLSTAGSPSPLGPIFTEEAITEAFLTISATMEGSQAKEVDGTQGDAKGDAKREAKRDAKREANMAITGQSAIDLLVNYALKKYSTIAKAQRLIDKMFATVGQPSSLGPVYTEEQITEAFLTISTTIEEQEAKQKAEEADAEAAEAAAERAEAEALAEHKAAERAARKEARDIKKLRLRQPNSQRRLHFHLTPS